MARTGFPVNVLINRSAADVPDGNTTDQRPNLVPGVPLDSAGGLDYRRMDQSCCLRRAGTGDIRRRAARPAPRAGCMADRHGNWKTIPLTERVRLEFRAEFFNIFNHPQYGLPQATFGVPSFGSITSTVNTTTPVSPVGSGTPREVQFALRIAF